MAELSLQSLSFCVGENLVLVCSFACFGLLFGFLAARIGSCYVAQYLGCPETLKLT